ncbi:MAG: ATP-dependent DNA helicase RecG [Candidatus Zixiibacteriota bacterium]
MQHNDLCPCRSRPQGRRSAGQGLDIHSNPKVIDPTSQTDLTYPMPNLRLDSPLQYVKGVGPRRGDVLAKHGLVTVNDLLHYFPRHYLDRTNVTTIASLQVGQTVTIIGEVKAHGLLHGKRKRYEVILQDDTGGIALIWFAGIQYWQRYFKKGQLFAATGVVNYFMGLQIVHPDLERLEDNTDKMIHAGRIIPVYPQTSELTSVGLNSKGMRQATTFIFENLDERVSDPLPVPERTRVNLMPLHDAIARIHYPENRDQIELARRRLAFDELLELQFFVYRNKGKKEITVKKHTYAEPGEKLKAFKADLQFPLTNEQKKVVREIFADLQRQHPMSRLLQGDVGCGKTVVAVTAAIYVAENNMQCAFMAPTEILAEQHFRNWQKPLAEIGVRSALITSSLTSVQKKRTAQHCADGEIDLLFGTHALIYDYVTFPRLGLVIIDEQHRFGVEQRGKLYAKGDTPDLLVMTATPIPRTLALTLYGDLDISTINELPPGRKPIRTAWRAADARDKVHEFVKGELDKGGQAYIIYPLIEKSEQTELLNVEDSFEELSNGTFRNYRTAMVHGRVKPKERDEILRQFREGEIQALFATTVIEVGLDNPNATILIIEHAERFGLAQLHQLRGRVGRGEKQATVVALAGQPISDLARQRLEYFVTNSDGFAIAEADLELRGPGEIFGLRQSGLPELRAAHLGPDRDLLESARALLERLFRDQQSLDTPYRALFSYLNESASRRDIALGGG